ncbi:MAG: hypothetical protein R3E21_07935 [Caenibius sp.]
MSNLPPELDFLSPEGRIASPARMDRMAQHLAARLRALEATRDAYNQAIQQLQDIGLQRLNEVLLPLFEEAQSVGDQLAAIFAQWSDAELILADYYSRTETDAAFAAIDHGHALDDIAGLVDELAAKADAAATAAALASKLALGGGTLTGRLVLVAGDAAKASLNLPQGVAPAAPDDGDLWYDAGGWRQRIGANTYTLATRDRAETLSNKSLLKCKDPEFTITDGASVNIDPANGSVQAWVLTANRTPAASLANGDSMTLHVRGAGFSVTWTTIGVVWVDDAIPDLPAAGYAVITLWKSGDVTRGSYVGQVAS